MTDWLKSQRERRAALLQEAQLEVSRFAGLVSSYWANDNTKCTGAALDEAKDKIVGHRTVFYDRMAEAYGRRPEEL